MSGCGREQKEDKTFSSNHDNKNTWPNQQNENEFRKCPRNLSCEGLKLQLQKSKSRKEPLETGNRCCLFHEPWAAEKIGIAEEPAGEGMNHCESMGWRKLRQVCAHIKS